jgi:glycosyltransferase involved in cell wall biosynthesis
VRRVLFLAYHFPPIGGAGVQRSMKFVRYLPEHGFEPLVVTGPGPVATDPWTPADETLRSELPKDLVVRRIRDVPPKPSAGIRGRFERRLGLPGPFGRWWVQEATTAAREAPQADLVYASLSPYESAVAAASIAAERRVPWVADLRDPWALDEMRVDVTGLHRRAERRRMRSHLASAAAIVMNTPEAARRLRETLPELGPRVVGAIPNGYDPADFTVPPEPRSDNAFRIVHTGYLHTEHGADQRRHAKLRRLLGGATPGLDVLTRSHVFLLRALETLQHETPALRIELHLAGVTSAADRAATNDSYVRFRGYLQHDETIALMRSADLLFLPMHNLPSGTRATIVPGKTYEYLGSGRPILAAVPDGDARDILSSVPHAYLCRPDDVEAMRCVVRELAIRRRDDGPEPDATSDTATVFARETLTSELARVFSIALDGHVARRENALVGSRDRPVRQ